MHKASRICSWKEFCALTKTQKFSFFFNFCTLRIVQQKLSNRWEVLFCRFPQKCLVYLKPIYLGNISERFSKKISEEINQIFSSVYLRTILYIDGPLKWNLQGCLLTQEKSNIIYKFSCHCDRDYVGKYLKDFTYNTISMFQRSWKLVWWSFGETYKKYSWRLGNICWTIMTVQKIIKKKTFQF